MPLWRNDSANLWSTLSKKKKIIKEEDEVKLVPQQVKQKLAEQPAPRDIVDHMKVSYTLTLLAM